MSSLAIRLRDRFYAHEAHPYRIFDEHVAAELRDTQDTLLDAGCGRTTPVLRRFIGKADRLIGVDLVEFTDVPPGIETLNADLSQIPLPNASVDVVMSRSVFEHLNDPEAVYRELARINKHGDRLDFLTANL